MFTMLTIHFLIFFNIFQVKQLLIIFENLIITFQNKNNNKYINNLHLPSIMCRST